MSSFRPWTVLAALWTVAVGGLMVLPSSSVEAAVAGWPTLLEIPALDKLLHAATFGLMTWLWIQARLEVDPSAPSAGTPTTGSWGSRSPWLLPLLAAIGYGSVLEGVQGLVPTRSPQWTDILANSVGAVAAVVLWKLRRPAPVL